MRKPKHTSFQDMQVTVQLIYSYYSILILSSFYIYLF